MSSSEPIYDRKSWHVIQKIAVELGKALFSCPAINTREGRKCKEHLLNAEQLATNYVLEDMREAEKCQRNNKGGDR